MDLNDDFYRMKCIKYKTKYLALKNKKNMYGGDDKIPLPRLYKLTSSKSLPPPPPPLTSTTLRKFNINDKVVIVNDFSQRKLEGEIGTIINSWQDQFGNWIYNVLTANKQQIHLAESHIRSINDILPPKYTMAQTVMVPVAVQISYRVYDLENKAWRYYFTNQEMPSMLETKLSFF